MEDKDKPERRMAAVVWERLGFGVVVEERRHLAMVAVLDWRVFRV